MPLRRVGKIIVLLVAIGIATLMACFLEFYTIAAFTGALAIIMLALNQFLKFLEERDKSASSLA